MEVYLYTLMLLVCGHFLFDFPLQNDYLAVNKSPVINGKYNEFWVWCMTGHSVLHALPVLLVLHSIPLALLMIITHFIIDTAKCMGHISYHKDQLLHLGIVFLIVNLHYYFL